MTIAPEGSIKAGDALLYGGPRLSSSRIAFTVITSSFNSDCAAKIFYAGHTEEYNGFCRVANIHQAHPNPAGMTEIACYIYVRRVCLTTAKDMPNLNQVSLC
jgi:hypothetical protein